MKRPLLSYAAVLGTLLALDLLWLGVVAQSMYQQALGAWMAERPNLAVAGLFYLVHALGLWIFAVRPQAAARGLGSTLRIGALFGFFAYATYDLTNLATLKGWPAGIALIDMAWGTLVSGLSAAAGKLVLQRFAD